MVVSDEIGGCHVVQLDATISPYLYVGHISYRLPVHNDRGLAIANGLDHDVGTLMELSLLL
jgi:hypothetical protein